MKLKPSEFIDTKAVLLCKSCNGEMDTCENCNYIFGEEYIFCYGGQHICEACFETLEDK
jgi:hypothetical protein